ncbi:PilZ domain-containing protein [Marinicaulis aureus]|uniref:PilZ domain-containing protein n=1 Tax=Hyphococcus aureus TaxID=2666033 RepID=A0ABW1KZB1_9PROT
MRKKDNRLTERLAAIKSAAPTITDGRIPPPKKRGPPDRDKRDAVFRPGKIYLSKSDQVRCVIRNVSQGGAYVHLEGMQPLPAIVMLRFEQTGVIKKARVAWQNDIEAGLAFVKDVTPGRTGPDPHEIPPVVAR